jgi:hypothetical protein
MSTTTKVKRVKQASKEQRVKDAERAKVLIQTFADLEREKEVLTVEYDAAMKPFYEDLEQKTKGIQKLHVDKLTTVVLSMSTAEKELLEIADRNRALFGVDDNWKFPDANHYLHLKGKTVVTLSKEFSMSKFLRKFGDYVKCEFKIAALMRVFNDADERGRIVNAGVDLNTIKSPELKKQTESLDK